MLIRNNNTPVPPSAPGVTTFTGLTDVPSAYTGQSLRRPRVNIGATALEFDYDVTNIINAEEARSDIRSTTRAGYTTFNSYAGLQALLNAAGEYAVIYLPPNGVFNLGAGLNNILQTAAQGQAIISSGPGAEIQNGNIYLANHLTSVQNLYLTGTSNYGVRVSGGDVFPSPSRFDPYWSHTSLKGLRIKDKTTGVLNDVAIMWSSWDDVWAYNCTTGFLLDHTASPTLDTGDIALNGCRAVRCGTGMKVVKVGGLRMTNGKIQSCTSYGLLISPSTAVTGVAPQGLYFANNSFEDCIGKEFYVTADVGVGVAQYPRWIQIVGGTIHTLTLDKCADVTVVGTLIDVGCVINSGAARTIIIGEPKAGVAITGTGTDYIVVGNNATNGPFIKVGARLTLIDSLNPTGKFL